MPQAILFGARRDRILNWVATAVTVFAATIAILALSMAAVVLWIT
jgi:hypothetical protein